MHVRLMTHNVVMNAQGVCPRDTIEYYCRTCEQFIQNYGFREIKIKKIQYSRDLLQTFIQKQYFK